MVTVLTSSMATVLTLEWLITVLTAAIVVQKVSKVWARRFAYRFLIPVAASHAAIIGGLSSIAIHFFSLPIAVQLFTWSGAILVAVLMIYHLLALRFGYPRVWFLIWENIWFTLERWACNIWGRLCPYEKASYWLDWLPAFCTRQRYLAQSRRVTYE